MDRDDGLWQEAAAGVQSTLDADLRDESYEVFVAEAARCRLVDRVGCVRVVLRCGVTLAGELAPDHEDAVDEHLLLLGADGSSRLVPVGAIASLMGSHPGLRSEADQRPRALASWLREIWASDEPIRCLDGSGGWTAGRLGYVGADHVELVRDGTRTVLPSTAVEAWQRG